MSANVASRMQSFSKESRQSRFKDFLQRDLAGLQDAPAAPIRYRLVAQSPSSPVALALASVAGELVAAGIVIEAIFLRLDRSRGADESHGLTGPGISCRVLADAHMIELHEQLVLGATSVWIGDCMRRDPARRDAFEMFEEGSPSSAAWASRLFDRVWSAGARVDLAAASRTVRSCSPRDLLAPALLGTPDDMPVVIALRH